MPVTLSGHLDRIVYQNEENNWTVARLKVKGRSQPVTIVGMFAAAHPGELLEVTGDWTDHPRFGPQFEVKSCRTLLPATTYGIEKYLGSGLIKGIGREMARRLVEGFGEETLEVIENDIERLKKIEGIGEKRIQMIAEAWNVHREMRDIMVFLQGHGVSTGLAAKIYKAYGHSALQVLQQNPYTLASDISGVGFLTADKLAQRMGFDRESVLRAEAGVEYVLDRTIEQGHVCYPQESLLKESEKLLDIPLDTVERGLRGIMDRGRAVCEEFGEGGRFIYRRPLYLAEKGLAKHLAYLIRYGANSKSMDLPPYISWAEDRLGLALDPEQHKAIEKALVNKVFVITGGPGTGKTTIIKAVIEIMNKRGETVLLAAPTGRAAKRMSQATGRQAKTIHRLLEYNPAQGGFKRNIDNPLRTDALIVDEVSMIDTPLMYHLLKAVPLEASLILVGDVNQLPSIGPGSVLKEIIEADIVEVTRLSRIFRQAQESSIIVNAHRVNQGLFPDILNQDPHHVSDFYFLEHDEQDKVLSLILELSLNRIPQRFLFDPLNDVQVITPMNRGTVGVHNLNLKLQEVLNPRSPELTMGERKFKTGDKVMQLRNNYEKEVFNGDIGRIMLIDGEERMLKVDFEGRLVEYMFSELDQLTLAYAISVHKSQGSEYPAVILPLVTQHYMLLQRNLVYTAITRGKKLVVVVGSKKAFYMAIRNDKPLMRHSHLKPRLRAEFL